LSRLSDSGTRHSRGPLLKLFNKTVRVFCALLKYPEIGHLYEGKDLEDATKENGLNSKTIFALSFLSIIAVTLIFAAYQVNRSKKEELWKEFEQKFKQVSMGDSAVDVLKLLGQRSRLEKPPPMNQQSSIYDNQNKTYNNLDAITGASVSLNAKYIYFELWHYDIATRTYSILFKPAALSSHEMMVYSKYYPGDIPDHISNN